MGIKIVNAMFGDETVSKDITKQIQEKASGGEINVIANSSLLPMFETTDVVTLSQQDKDDIRDKAIEQCGGGSDTRCIAATSQTLTRSRFQEKKNEIASTVNQVKGRRLTVVVNDKGVRRTLVIPDGQKFELKGLETPRSEPWDLSAGNVLLSTITTGIEAGAIIWAVIGAFLYIFQIFATAETLRTLENLGPFSWKYYGGLASSILLPFSGFLIMFGIYAYRGYLESSA
jgi:hypothetical protein